MTDNEPLTGATDAGRARRRRWPWVAAGVIVFLVIALVWFQPQKLLIDTKVDDEVATSGDSPEPTSEPSSGSSPSSAAMELASGTFISIDHTTSGAAVITDLGGGRRVLRLEGLETSNGPDLFVYLAGATIGSSEQEYDDEIVNLGRLKGNIGSQNYDIPPEVDLAAFASVVIWCDRFNSAFGAAPIQSA